MSEHARRSSQPLASITPAVEFPVTICVVCYGRNIELARRFLSTLYRCTAPSLFTLRAGLNEVEPATLELFHEYAERFGNIELFIEPQNIFKNPLMRRMFREKPLVSRWTIWCDDDTHFTRSDWLQRLGLKIECAPEVAMWGKLFVLWSRDEFVLEWIRAAAWYRGLPPTRETAPDGAEATKFCFATGAFWAARTEVLSQINWPDPRLIHANEDFLLSEALRQNGWKLGRFASGVNINDAPRRNAEAAEVSELRTTNRHGLKCT